MSSSTVTISPAALDMLQELADRAGEPMETVLEKAIEAYRRQRFLEEANAAYAALRSDPAAWQAELEERRAWEVTLADDLEER